MKAVLALLFVCVAAAFASDIIPNEYVIQLKNGLAPEQLAVHVKTMQANFSGELGNEIIKTIDGGEHFQAIHARLTPRMVAWTMAHENVMVVEPNRVFTASNPSPSDCNIQQDVIWNLARVDEREISLIDTEYHWDVDASNVDVYVIDTGVLITHTEFGGRAVWGYNAADSTNADCNGHGTHVAGTIGGKIYGIAKGCKIIAVKVLTCGGSGTTAGVADGVAWTGRNAQATGRRSVANMSLGGGRSTIIDNAVEAAVKAGVSMIVAAGNDNANACNYSPAGTPNAVTVGATTLVEAVGGLQEDRRASFSNYGSCVDIFAPGQLIKAAWIGASNSVTNTISGTSMASPHVCGVAALLLAREALTPADVTARLNKGATNGVVDLNCSNSVCLGSPNSFLYTNCA